MFESIVAKLTSPPLRRRHASAIQERAVYSEPEEDDPPTVRRPRASRLLDKKRRARLSCADLTVIGVESERPSRMDTLKSFLPLRQSKSLGRLDGIKEMERLAAYERVAGVSGTRRRAARLSDLERVQDLFPHDYLALHHADAHHAHTTQKTKGVRKRPSLDLASFTGGPSPRTFIMEAPVHLSPLGSGPPLDRHLFLFSDLLLLGKSRANNCFKLKESIRLAEVWLALADNDDTGFVIGWPTCSGVVNYLATYPTQAARDSWFRKIQNALNAQLMTEPKSTNIQIFYKDLTSAVEFFKTVSVSPELTVPGVVTRALAALGGGVDTRGAVDFVLGVRFTRDAPVLPLHGSERPHAIQISRIRQTLSNEDGFDLEHVNAKNNPCGLIFELRKKNASPKGGVSLNIGRSGRLFGVPLSAIWRGGVPPPLLLALRRLRVLGPSTHGIFRRSANAKALRVLRDKLDALGPQAAGCAEVERAPPLLLAALVKDYFRALPEPLLGAELHADWLHLAVLSPVEKVAAARSLLLKLPKPNYCMLMYFICLLQAIAKKASINLMCATNLSVCVGPSLLWSHTLCDRASKTIPGVIELLIVKAEALFGPQVTGLLGSGSPESSNALLDSGAEESDSLHSVGISLDSMEINAPRKEKLSLSRDSGLTLSEDDSNSNGGNSPAPRNTLHNQTVTGQMQADTKIISKYNSDRAIVNGLSNISNQCNIYSNKSEMQQDNAYVTHSKEHYVRDPSESSRISMESYNQVSKSASQRSSSSQIYEQNPERYITGLEPQKPPRSNISKTARTSKVHSMFAGALADSVNKNFNKAKSSDNLLEPRQAADQRGFISSQEDLVYSNISDLAMFTENIQRQNMYGDYLSDVNKNYSRVYNGWELSPNYNRSVNNGDSIYDHLKKSNGCVQNSRQDPNITKAATIFTRNDWTRQAARTKSLDKNEEVDENKTQNYNYEINDAIYCRKRRFDPAHLCTNNCTMTPPISIKEQGNMHSNQQNSYASYTNQFYNNTPDYNNLYNTTKSLYHTKSSGDIAQNDLNCKDSLYEQCVPKKNTSSFPNKKISENEQNKLYATQYVESLYNSVYNQRSEPYLCNGNSIFASDIYKATPTAVQPEFTSAKEQIYKKPPHIPPPVPPRKMIYNRILKKFPPVHVNKEDKTQRSKSASSLYRSISNDGGRKSVIDLGCTETDTESESYV